MAAINETQAYDSFYSTRASSSTNRKLKYFSLILVEHQGYRLKNSLKIQPRWEIPFVLQNYKEHPGTIAAHMTLLGSLSAEQMAWIAVRSLWTCVAVLDAHSCLSSASGRPGYAIGMFLFCVFLEQPCSPRWTFIPLSFLAGSLQNRAVGWQSIERCGKKGVVLVTSSS